MIKILVPEDSTVLDPDDSQFLIPKHILTQDQLNDWEQSNIIEAEKWLFSNQKTEILTVRFVQVLHKKMFDRTWKWAGNFRKTNKNIGIDWPFINLALGKLLEETKYYLKNNTYSVRETLVRFHHQLVFIHCFDNGNGRHARLMSDFLLNSLGEKRFNWGKDLYCDDDNRKKYITALKKADNYDYEDLIKFAEGELNDVKLESKIELSSNTQ